MEELFGILLVDKPKGITSHDVISRLRKALRMKRIGHAGTLDPAATGLLILCLGKATKISSLLMESDKTYLAKLLLGKESTTYDMEGDVVAERPVDVTRGDLEAALQAMTGTREQKPPLYSAVKVGGKKLYEYARENLEVEVPVRTVTLHSIRLLSFAPPEAEIEVHCSKGTYIRSLIHDVGQALKTGALAMEIRRTESGPLQISRALSLQAILDSADPEARVRASLIPISQALAAVPQLFVIHSRWVDRVRNGNGLTPEETRRCRWNSPVTGRADSVLVIGEGQEALAVGSFEDRTGLRVRRVI